MGDITSILDALATPDGMIASPADLVNNQFGVPLAHLSQQYLFGATGLRLRWSTTGSASSWRPAKTEREAGSE